MITIVVTHEDDQSDEFDFSPSQPTITIGRRSTNDVCIPNLSVSGRHARIAFTKGEAWIEDLNSTNGTYINNRLISRQILNNNDELVIGKTRVRFLDSANRQTAIQAEPAEVIDIRNVEPYNESSYERSNRQPRQQLIRHARHDDQNIERGEFNGEFNIIDGAEDSDRNMNLSDTGFPLPDEQYNDDGLDDALNEGTTRRAPIAPQVGSAAAVGAAVVMASGASGQNAGIDSKPNADATGPEDDPASLFDALADDLSHRENRERNAQTNTQNGIQQDTRQSMEQERLAQADPMDDSSQMSLSDRAKVALGRNAGPTSATSGAAKRSEASVAGEKKPVDLSAKRTIKKDGATIQIKNGAKSGHIIPIDKPVTTLGRPGIQIAAIMRKPDGYFLMHIESNDSVDRPTLNNDLIGDEPMLLHPGDEMNVAGINVEFDLVTQSAPTTA